MTTIKRLVPVALAASVLVGLGTSAVPAHAEGLGGITGWQPVPSECGRTNYVPVVITNATDQSQTGSVTVPYGTATQVGIYNSQTGCTHQALCSASCSRASART